MPRADEAGAESRDHDAQPELVQLADDREAEVGAEHVEGAVSQVEDSHDAERQGETGCEKKEDERV